jgi:phospholipid/cholesterol/gamma-HCH transport system substrate-binding protein
MRLKIRARLAAAAIAGGLALSSCASLNVLNVNALPVPGQSYRGGYDIIVEFANVLNLPERAKVVMDGTPVGVTTKVTLTGRGVDVTSRIGHGVVVPSNIHAVLQQATVLGDTYIALERPAGADSAAPPLVPGGRIPIIHTTSPPQLEDTIASLATFIGSGSIQKAQNSLIRINRVTPPPAEIREIASRVAVDLSDLSKNIDNVDLWLQGVSQTADVMAVSTPSFNYWFTPVGVRGFHHNFLLTHVLAPVLPAIGTIYFNGYWLVPGLESIAGAFEAFQHSKWAFDEEVPRWQHLVTDFYLPERKYPAINITSIVGPDGRELSGNVQQVLRMIGAMP